MLCDELIIRSIVSSTPCAKRQQKWVLAACVLGSSMAFIDSSVVNVALPKMESELGATLSAMTWVINSYTLCMSALLLIGGALADQVGRRRIFVTGLSIFAVASVGCGLALDLSTLILTRAVQGVGAALLIPCSLAIIGAVFDEKERGAAIGVWSGASAIAAGGGPLLGAWLVDHASWRAIFLSNPIVAIPTILIAVRRVPESVDPEARKGLDLTGAALAFLGLVSLVYGLIAASDRGGSNSIVVFPLLAGAALLVGFVVAEGRGQAPMMPLEVFRSVTFSGVNILTLLLYGALGGAMFFLPFLLIQVHGYSATEAGAVFLPFTSLLALLSRWGGRLADRFGARIPLIVGPVIVGIGLFLLALPGTGGSYWATFLVPFLVLGFGMSITVAPLTTTVLRELAARADAAIG
jgi:EmrB/QacA subfamily drug resistance transporter